MCARERVIMRDFWMTVLLGIVEGITEFLPISSTGHLILIEKFLDQQRTDFFNVGIQAGAVLAVVLIYWKRILDLVRHWRKPQNLSFILKIAAAFFITAVLGITSRKLGFKLSNSDIRVVAAAVLIGAVAIFWVELRLKNIQSTKYISWPMACIVGLAQVVAGLFPGTSRSAATMLVSMWMGSSRSAAAEFSFILGIPTMFAASGYMLLEDLKDRGTPSQEEILHFSIGFIVSMIVAFIAVKWLLRYIQTHTFILFAWYRLILGVLLLIALWILK